MASFPQPHVVICPPHFFSPHLPAHSLFSRDACTLECGPLLPPKCNSTIRSFLYTAHVWITPYSVFRSSEQEASWMARSRLRESPHWLQHSLLLIITPYASGFHVRSSRPWIGCSPIGFLGERQAWGSKAWLPLTGNYVRTTEYSVICPYLFCSLSAYTGCGERPL